MFCRASPPHARVDAHHCLRDLLTLASMLVPCSQICVHPQSGDVRQDIPSLIIGICRTLSVPSRVPIDV